jgi:hypothetical protein
MPLINLHVNFRGGPTNAGIYKVLLGLKKMWEFIENGTRSACAPAMHGWREELARFARWTAEAAVPT